MQIRIRIDVSRLFWHISFRTTPDFADVTTFYTYPEPTPIIAGFNKTNVFSDLDVDRSSLGKTAYFGLKNWFVKSKSGLRSSQRVC